MRRANDAEGDDDDDDDFERAFIVTARIHENVRDDGTRAFDVDDAARAKYWKKSKSRANVVLVTFLEEYAREIEGGGRVSAAALRLVGVDFGKLVRAPFLALALFNKVESPRQRVVSQCRILGCDVLPKLLARVGFKY